MSIKSFAYEIIDLASNGANFDGADIQEIAVKHDLLRLTKVTESCGENCICAEFDDFPQWCYRKTDLLLEKD